MITISLRTRDPSPKALPAALVFSSQRLLTEKSSVTVKPGAADVKTKALTIRASSRIAMFKDFEDYSHCGINE